MEFTIDNIEKLVFELYHNQNETLQSQANEFLTLAQVSPQAWQFSKQLLDNSKPIEVQYFGANTLYFKVSKFWHELDTEKQLELRNLLINSLISYLPQQGCRIIEKRLSLALAAFVVNSVGSTWENAIEELMTTLQPNNWNGISGDRILQVLIELLSLIPEEFQTTHFTMYQRTITRSALLKSINQVFQLIHAVMSEQQITNDLKQSSIKCFANWSEKTGPLIITDAHEQLITMVLQAVCDEELCQTAVDALTNIYSHPEIHKHPLSVLQLIDKMICLESVLCKAIQESNADLCSCIYNLFIQIAETHSRLLLDTIIDKPQHRDSIFKLIQMILQCSASPGHYPVDETYSEQAFNFWYTLQDDIIASDESRIQTYLTLFNPLFQSLIGAFLTKVQFPPDDIYEKEWTNEDKESFRCYRQDIGDSFMYCYNILRVSMLSSLTIHFTLAGNDLTSKLDNDNGKSWQYLEAVIYTFGSIAENVDIEESTYLPQIFNSLPKIPFHQVQSPRLMSTTMDMIAAYSEWIFNHTSYLPNVIQLMMLGLKSHQQVTISATMALKDIIRECQTVIQPYSGQVLSVCEELLKETRLKPKEQARLMCTVGLVLSIMPIDMIMNSIEKFVTPIFFKLQNIINQCDQNPANCPAFKDEVANQLNMLAMLFSTLDVNLKRVEIEEGDSALLKSIAEKSPKNTETPQPIYIVLQQVLPLLANIAYKWSCDEMITESVCECIKKSVITLLNEIKPLVSDIVELLMHLYSANHQSSILEISKQLITLFGKDPDLDVNLKNFYVQLCNHTLALCQENLRQQTNLIEHFYLISTYILKKMNSFYQYNLLDVASMFRCAMSSLNLHEKPTVKAVATFISEFINNSREIEGMNKIVNEEVENLVGQVLIVIGGTRDSPRSVVEFMAEILMSLNQKYFDNLCRCINIYIQKDNFPTSRVQRDQKEHFIRLILKERKNKRKLREIINEFSLTCRGLIGTEYGNQPIKLPF